MTEEAKTFTQADIDALQAEHTKAIAELNDRHKGELNRKVEQAIKKATFENNVQSVTFRNRFTKSL